MYKETVKTKNKTFFLIVGAILLYAAAMGVTGALNLPYKSVVQTAFLFILAVCVYICMRFSMASYEYSIVKDGENTSLAVTSILGSAQKFIANADIKKIKYIAPFGAEVLDKTKEIYRYNARTSVSKKDTYICVFEDEKNKLSKLMFNPSERLIRKLGEFDNITIYTK